MTVAMETDACHVVECGFAILWGSGFGVTTVNSHLAHEGGMVCAHGMMGEVLS